jgi:hypothetical protein
MSTSQSVLRGVVADFVCVLSLRFLGLNFSALNIFMLFLFLFLQTGFTGLSGFFYSFSLPGWK